MQMAYWCDEAHIFRYKYTMQVRKAFSQEHQTYMFQFVTEVNWYYILILRSNVLNRDKACKFWSEPGGGVLLEFLGGDVPLGPWNP